MVMATNTPQGVRINPQNTLELSQGMSIQTAIDTADAHGGNWTILLYPGTAYDEGDLTPNGGANITLKGMGEDRVRITPTAAPATAVIVSAHNLHIEDITVGAPDATRPALRVTGGVFEATRCSITGVGAGDAIQQVGGNIEMHDCYIPAGDVDLSTAACTLEMTDCEFLGTIDTAGAFAHNVTIRHCDCHNQAFNLAATGACVYDFESNNEMGTITDGSLGAGAVNGTICRCHAGGAGLVKNGTTGWLVDNSELANISNANATGVIYVYGGIFLACGSATGVTLWYKTTGEMWVLPSGATDDINIQAAINALPAGGGKVSLQAGQFVCTAGVALSDYVVLEGQGSSATELVATGAFALLAGNCNNWMVRGITLTGDSDTGYGIYASRNREHVTIEDVAAHDFSTGIDILSSSHIRILRCVSYSNAGTGIYVSQETGYQRSDDVLIWACETHHNGNKGISTELSDYFTVEDCYSHDNTSDSFHYESPAVNGKYGRWINCVSTDSGGAGISSTQLDYGLIDGCVSETSASHGFYLETPTSVIQNSYVYLGRPGIEGSGVVANNILVYCSTGIRDCCQYADIHDNVILETYHDGAAYGAINPSGAHQRWHDNLIKDCTRTCPTALAGTDVWFYNNTIENSTEETLSTKGWWDNSEFHAFRKYTELFMDVLAASTTHIRNNEDLSAAIPITFTIDAQPDCPRSITWILTHANITAFTLEITGTNAKGKTITETFTEAAGWSGETDNAFLTITSIKMTARTGTGVGDTCDVGIGSKLGITNKFYHNVNLGGLGILKVKKNNADWPAASYTVSATYHTVDVSTGGAIVGGDDFTIWYRSNLNIVG